MSEIKYIICFLVLVNIGFSQQKNNEIKILTNSTPALIVVNEVMANEFLLKKNPSENIESLVVLKDKAAILKNNELGKNGVIEIKTKGISKRKLKKLHELYPFKTEVNLNKLNNYSNIKNTEISDSINPIAMQKLLDKVSRQENQKTIYGIVSDCENFPLPKVFIKNINTQKSTTSDSLGNYTIEANKKDIILFSKPNYETQQFEFLNKKEINIKLKEVPKNDIILEKPVIYLYPKEKTDIELKINFEGKLLTTFPKLDKSWKVTAYENGQIFDKKTNRFYNSLFWDGEMSFPASHYQYKTGFVVEKEKLATFLIEKLEFMGLNTAETNDFIQYWLPILEQNDYTFIHFLVNDDYNVFSTNDVNPKPDTSIRIFMEFFGVDEKLSILPQKLPSTVRTGFTLVEWGGSDVSNAIDIYELLENKNFLKYITLNDKIDWSKTKILYILNNKKISKKTFDKLKCEEILKIEVFDSKKGGAMYAEEGRNGVISVTSRN